MIDELKRLGFERIAIVDDTKANIGAARQAGERLNGIAFEFYMRGDLLVAQIPRRYKEIGLILTDRQMETDDAGLDVVEKAWSYLVPAFVCSGGYAHANKPRLRVAPDIARLELPDGMLKDNPDTWYRILEGIIAEAGYGSSLLGCALRARHRVELPEAFFGEQARKIAQGDLDFEKRFGQH
jgi:hypothetical protein